MAADIFNESVGFHRNERCSLAYNKRFYENLHGANFGNPLSLGCGMSFCSRDTKSSSIRVQTAKSSSFTFTVNSASAVRGDAAVMVPERLGHQT